MNIPDLYEFNPEPNWIRLRLQTSRVILKASEGVSHVDAKFPARYRKARLVGMGVAAYHFSEPDLHTAQAEAAHFLACIGSRKFVHLALDVETRKGHDPLAIMGPAKLEQWCRDFNHVVHRKTGIWPLFYANADYIHRLHLTKGIGGGLWLASYGPNNGKQHPAVPPPPWKHITLHQFTSVGSLAGMHPVDLSAGTL